MDTEIGLWARVKKLCDWCCNPKYMWSVWSLLGTLLLVMVIWWALGTLGLLPTGDFPRVPGEKWQAVFLTNNQVYFGHLDNYNNEYARLKDVYYLRVAQSLQQGAQQAQQPVNLNLVKLGTEIHGPEDLMFIPKRQILFWENLSPGSDMVRGIESTRR